MNTAEAARWLAKLLFYSGKALNAEEIDALVNESLGQVLFLFVV